MSWPDLADQALVATRDVFGEAALYTRLEDASVTSITAIYDEDAVIVSPELGAPVRSGKPGIGVRLSDLPAAPERGDRVTVRSEPFQVVDVVRDGQGGALLLLHRL